MQPLTCQSHRFDIEPEVHYLNCAYMSPQLRQVTEVGQQWLLRKSRPYQLSLEDFFNPVKKLKQQFAQLINADDYQRIAIIPSVSYGIENVARNLQLKRGDEIIIIKDQFPSNYYPWKAAADQAGAIIRVVSPPDGLQSRGAGWQQAILQAINPRTRLVAMAHSHWADGTRFDLVSIRQKTKQHNAWLVIDGTQSVGAMDFDIAQIQPDALICAGYKWLLGPYGLGVAYYGPSLDEGSPVEENWINRLNSHDFKNLVNYQPAYQSKAARYSMGEQSNFLLVPMLTEGIRQLCEWQPRRITEYCRSIARSSVEKLLEMGCQIEEEPHRSDHLLGVRLPEHINLNHLSELFQQNRVFVSVRGNSIRVAPNVYNTEDDFQMLVACFKKALV